MSRNDVQDHLLLSQQTGKHKFTAEQLEIIRKLEHGGPVLELEEDVESTLELPQLRK